MLKSRGDGWNNGNPDPVGDCRKLVTLEKDGMVWIGIRAWSESRKVWLNNGILAQDRIIAWQDLPHPAINDGLMEAMPSPTLGDHWTT